MKLTALEELENQLNEIGVRLCLVESLSKILLKCIYEKYDLKSKDIQNLICVLNEKISNLKEHFNLIEQELIF